jgi:hypothetical protein
MFLFDILFRYPPPLFYQYFCIVGLAQGGVHLLANDFDKRPLRRDKFDLLMQERERRNNPKNDQ